MTVEMALCLPVLLVTIIGMLEFSRVHMLRESIEDAAYIGARVAKVPGGTSEEAEATIDRFMRAVGVSTYSVTVSPEIITESTESITVAVTVPIAENSWGTAMFTRSLQLSGSATLKTERFRLPGQ